MRTPAVVTPGADLNPGADLVPGARTLPRAGVVALAAAGLFLAMLAIPVVVSGAMGLVFDGRVMPRVAVAGIDVGMLTAAEAEARLRAVLPDATGGELVLTIDGTSTTIPFSTIGRDHDYARMVASALAIGRSGDLWVDGQARLATLVVGSQVPDALAADPTRLNQLVLDTATAAFVRPTDASVVINPDGTYAIANPAPGRRVEPEAIRTALAAAVREPGAHAEVALSSEPVPFTVTRETAAIAAGAARAMLAAPLALIDDDDTFTIAAADLSPAIGFGSTPHGYGVVIDRAALSEAVTGLAPSIERAPQNATFAFGPNGPTGVTPAVDGRTLSVPATVSAIVDALERRGVGIELPSVALATSVVEPGLTTAAAQEILPKLVRISTWTTYYVVAAGNGWGNNISIPARDLDGMLILPGEDFDFWRDIGPVTFERGYSYGGAIIGGRSTGDQAIGGGICSTSTTLFNTALRAGLQMGSRANHYYYIDRYPMGLDATVFATDYYAQSMTFTNDTESPLMIRSYASPGVVRFDLWGMPLNRTVSFTNPVTWNHTYGHDTVEYTSSLPTGVSQRTEYIHNGFSVSVTRKVTDNATGAVIHTDEYVSHYQTVNGVVLVGR
ncbi:MAG TPA: VanW family protein [Candidatus Limnocylindria bacterium]